MSKRGKKKVQDVFILDEDEKPSIPMEEIEKIEASQTVKGMKSRFDNSAYIKRKPLSEFEKAIREDGAPQTYQPVSATKQDIAIRRFEVQKYGTSLKKRGR